MYSIALHGFLQHILVHVHHLLHQCCTHKTISDFLQSTCLPWTCKIRRDPTVEERHLVCHTRLRPLLPFHPERQSHAVSSSLDCRKVNLNIRRDMSLAVACERKRKITNEYHQNWVADVYYLICIALPNQGSLAHQPPRRLDLHWLSTPPAPECQLVFKKPLALLPHIGVSDF